MNKIKEAQDILNQLGLPLHQQNEMAALTFLALCGINKNSKWLNAKRTSMGISKGIMNFVSTQYNRKYAANTRETFRRHVLHQFVQAGIVDYNPDKPDLPVNSPNAHYAINIQSLRLVKTYKTGSWIKTLKAFIGNLGTLKETYNKEKAFNKIPLKLNDGKSLILSPGRHNLLQVEIIKEFAPRFIEKGKLLYLGDTAKKNLYILEDWLKELKIPINQHSKLPDIVIYDEKKKWLFLIEAVTSHGPVTPKRIFELEKLLKKCTAGKVYVTAFPDFSEFKKHSKFIAWETEVWISEEPDHMIHFNGDKFFGPR